MKILWLPIKRKWLDMIVAGIKPEEYRDIKPHYINMFMNKDGSYKTIDTIGFHWYRPNSHTGPFELLGISQGFGNPKWGAPTNKRVFIIKLGKIIERN